MGSSGGFSRDEPSVRGIDFKEKEVTSGNTYEVYTGPSRSAAMEFLRQTEVKEERHYVVVETPEGNVAKDLITIFNEGTQEFIEYGKREPLGELRPSMSSCARCGYPVLPAGQPLTSNTIELITVKELQDKGVGFVCRPCGTLWCPFCVSFEDYSLPLCDICGKGMEICRE